jgi:adenylate cyclase
MNVAYRDFIEYLDDLIREYFDCRNVELSSCTDDTEKAYLIWEGQKASQFFEDAGVDLTQLGMAKEMLSMLGLPRDGWMAETIVNNFRLEPNEAFDS